jgi:hypothetical protein
MYTLNNLFENERRDHNLQRSTGASELPASSRSEESDVLFVYRSKQSEGIEARCRHRSIFAGHVNLKMLGMAGESGDGLSENPNLSDMVISGHI